MPRMPVEQAAMTAFMAYLKSYLLGVYGAGAFLIEDRFPEPDVPLWSENAPNLRRRVTILEAGQRQDMHVTPQVVSAESVDDHMSRYRWRMKACSQPLQMDLWAVSDAELKTLRSHIDDAMHQGPSVTMPGVAGVNRDPVRDGVLLSLTPDTGHEGFADVMFEGPTPINDGASAMERSYRAMYRGQVDIDLCVIAESPRLARIILSESLGYTLVPDGDRFVIGTSTL